MTITHDYNILFQFQYYLESLNSYYLNHFNYLSIIILFVLGCISGINPCVLSMLPVYNTYLSIENNNRKKKYQSFIGGMYTGIIIIITLSSTIYNPKLYNRYTFLLIGLIILLLGYQQLQINKLQNNSIFIKKILQYLQKYENSILGNYILGIGLGIIGTSCSTPSIVTLSLLLQNSEKTYLTLLFISIYAAGYILPIFFFNKILNTITFNIQKLFFAEWLRIFGGNTLITIGTYYILFYFDKYL